MRYGRGSGIAILAMLPAGFWPGYTLLSVLRYVAMAYLFVGIGLRARAGYLRRRPHWTPESWRRFHAVCGLFVAALLVCIAMGVAVEYRLPIAGGPRSGLRIVWVVIMMIFMVAGAIGLSNAVRWLHEGEASAQFTKFQKAQG